MSENKELFIDTEVPAFMGKKLNLPAISRDTFETGIVHRSKNSIFNYFAWPSICSDENGVLYATSAAFGTDHICPFTKAGMYVSRNGGKTWTPPMIIADGYLPTGSASIVYLGNGKMIAGYGYHPGDVLYQDFYTRINGTLWGDQVTASGKGLLRQTLIDLYPTFPVDQLIGGILMMTSDDYGVTWNDPVRVPVINPHGPCRLPDGTLLLAGQEFYADPSETYKVFEGGAYTRFKAKNWASYLHVKNTMRSGRDCDNISSKVYASRDGGKTWEHRATFVKPDHIHWNEVAEPHMVLLPDGTLLTAFRVEDEAGYENDFTVYLTRSTDNGFTWSDWECTHIPGSPAHLLVHSSGALICSVGQRNDRTGPMGIYAYVSHDGGHTWTERYCLAADNHDNDLGYPATAELPDGRLLTVYYLHYTDPAIGKRDDYPSILYTNWEL